MIIDAENMILGRIASFAAKKALLGEKVDIVNCEKAVITGNRKQILARQKQKRDMGRPTKGPFISRLPDRFVRRSVRGMLPYKQEKGKSAFKRVMCYIGIPDEFKDKKTAKPEGADISKLSNMKYVTINDICKYLGAK